MSPAPRQSASTVARYLKNHAEPVSLTYADAVHERYRNVLVVPCFAEPLDFLTRMRIPDADTTLTIIVVNAPDNAAALRRAQTLDLLTHLENTRTPNQLIVDLVRQPLPWREGVGLARKTGADIALRLIADGRVEHPWIHNTDADVRLPADYFQPASLQAAADDPGMSSSAPGTLLFEFRHKADDPELSRRANLYELHLRYYVHGLAAAGSEYAFPTLGSIIAVSAFAYAAVRGFPRRNAAEDFYLLNKLAKVGPLTVLGAPVLELSGRVSDRVPFGTGPALARMPTASDDYVSHARDAFRSLADVLAAMRTFAVDGTWQPPANGVDWLEQLGWARFQPRLDAVETQSQRQRRLREWFDAFRTMRYLRLAAARYPQRPLLETLRTELIAADRSMTAEELLGLLRHNGNPFTLS